MNFKGNAKVILVFTGCAFALAIIIWALVASLTELSTVWYW
jgi:hypothetical protein